MGEEKRHSFDDEVERRGLLATRFNFATGFGLPNWISVDPTHLMLSSMLWTWWRELKTVLMSTVSPLMSASHSVLGNPAGALAAHLIHLLTAA